MSFLGVLGKALIPSLINAAPTVLTGLGNIVRNVGHELYSGDTTKTENQIGNTDMAMNAGLYRQSEVNRRIIPTIQAPMSGQGAGTFNPASMGEWPLDRIQQYEAPQRPLRQRRVKTTMIRAKAPRRRRKARY